MPKGLKRTKFWAIRGLALLVVVPVFILLTAVAAIRLSERKTFARSEALRAKVRVGAPWSEVAAQLGADSHWHSISFHGERADCVFVSGGGSPSKNVPGHYALLYSSKSVPIQGLMDSRIQSQLKSCPKAVAGFHPAISFQHVDFSVLFDPYGKVIATTPSRTWD